jgi:hypothetical protein
MRGGRGLGGFHGPRRGVFFGLRHAHNGTLLILLVVVLVIVMVIVARRRQD